MRSSESVGRSGPFVLRFPSRGFLAGALEFGCFAEAMRPGAYLRIVVEGSVGAGDKLGWSRDRVMI
jgi:hypothetical protein